MSIGGGVGGGNNGTSSGGIQGTPTFLGTSAGQNQTGQDSQLQSLLQQYMGNQQGNTALNNFLVGGQGFNPNGMVGGGYAPGGAASGNSGAGGPSPYGSTSNPFGINPNGGGAAGGGASGGGASGGGASGGGGGGAAGGAAGAAGGGSGAAGGGGGAPTGGLIGQYQGLQANPWQTGPGGANEADALGSYNWMASGDRTNGENSVYDRTGDMARSPFGVDASGRSNGTVDPNDPSQTLEGEGNQFNQNLMGGKQSALEQGATGGYQDFAGGPNAQEKGLYGDTSQYGSTVGKDLGTASGAYQGMVNNGGYDEATKAAMTTENLNAARSPFETARENIARSASSRGNPSAAIGAQIALARDESKGVGSASRQNLIDQAQEKIRQREAGAQGLQGTQGISNAQQQYALGQRAGQNAQLAGQKLAGTQGLANMGAAQRANQAQGAASNVALSNQNAANKFQSLAAQNLQNQQQRATTAAGLQGATGMFNTMAQRQAGATAGLQGLYNTGQGVAAGQQAGAANLGTTKVQDSTGFANMNNQGAAGASI